MIVTDDRPPDLNLDADTIPGDCFLLEGQYLAETMRRAKLPFGVAKHRQPLPCGQRHLAAAGLIMFVKHRSEVDKAMAKRAANKIHAENYKKK